MSATNAHLAGRVAVVTGSGRGIGRATAVALARAGASRVALVARTASQLEEVARDVEQAGAEPLIVGADVSVIAEIDALAERLLAELGQVDVLINNAATVAPLGPTPALDLSAVLDAFRLNVVAPIGLAGRLAPGMVERGWGRIVNLSSGAVANARNAIGSGVYAATKSAVETYTVALAAELAGTGVTVNAYRPGTTDTSMMEWMRAQDPAKIGHILHDRFVTLHESGSMLRPEKTAEALVAHLVRESSGEIWDVTDRL